MVMLRFALGVSILAAAGGLLALAGQEPAAYRTVVADNKLLAVAGSHLVKPGALEFRTLGKVWLWKVEE
jgi:hypothetical protein